MTHKLYGNQDQIQATKFQVWGQMVIQKAAVEYFSGGGTLLVVLEVQMRD
jgi:hypothetical protein